MTAIVTLLRYRRVHQDTLRSRRVRVETLPIITYRSLPLRRPGKDLRSDVAAGTIHILGATLIVTSPKRQTTRRNWHELAHSIVPRNGITGRYVPSCAKNRYYLTCEPFYQLLYRDNLYRLFLGEAYDPDHRYVCWDIVDRVASAEEVAAFAANPFGTGLGPTIESYRFDLNQGLQTRWNLAAMGIAREVSHPIHEHPSPKDYARFNKHFTGFFYHVKAMVNAHHEAAQPGRRIKVNSGQNELIT